MQIKSRTHLLSIALGTLTTLALGIPAIANAADLQLSGEQPTVISSLDSGSETRKATYESDIYIVQLADSAVASYMGGVEGYAATSNHATGFRKLDTNSEASQEYSGYLRKTQKEFIADCEASFGHTVNVKYDYQYALNGVAVQLSPEEAETIRAMPGIKNVTRERMEFPLTDVGPQWIGAPEIWGNSGKSGKGSKGSKGSKGKGKGQDHSRGEGIVVAILDTGINSDHASYADIGGDGYDHTNPLGSGNFVPGSYCDTTDPSFCNDKLIGAWSFVTEAVTPEDSDGHGSHTSSTAAGNAVRPATLFAPTTQFVRDISGVAPHANIIMYDVCVVGCPGSALLAAINQVLIDSSNLPNGIHALNFSISGGGDPYNDLIELGFLNAVEAGVYVAASAGNSGPGASTVAHLGPWVSTTAAMTHNRAIENNVVGLSSDGGALADIAGLGLTSGLGTVPIVHASSTAFDPTGQCLTPFPAATFSGEIVVCDRGTIARTAKGSNVLAGGAGGFVLANLDAQGESIVADAHFLPGVHIGDADGDVLRAWLAANTGTMASITGFSLDLSDSNGDIMAGFSSRGPNQAFSVLKPDIGGPGVGIMAADANDPSSTAGDEIQFLSGTSMSSPHNAGSGALMSAVQPDWTPAEIKSALMMTAKREGNVKEDGVTPTDPFDDGAGRLNLSYAAKAGLVLSESAADFLAADPALGGDPGALNLASMQNNSCVGTCTWTRELTNVENKTINMKLSTTSDPGLKLSTSGKKLKVKKGKSETVTVTADTTLAAPGWNFGSLEMGRKGKGPDLHMPIAVFAATSSNPDVLSKTVDAPTAAKGEPLNYTISITNGQLGGQIDLVDELPGELDYVAGSAMQVVTNGTTIAPFAVNGGTATWSGMLDQGGLDLIPSSAPLGFFSISGFLAPFGCPANCDDGSFVINVPSFVFNGQSYSQVIMSVNGTLEAGSASGQGSSFFNQNLPDSSLPNNIMAPFWTDLNMGADGDGAEWYVGVFNLGPDQFTIYEWNNIPLFGDLSNRYSFQIWVQNGPSGNIWYTYGQLGTLVLAATVGVENDTGTIGQSYFYNTVGTPPALGTDLMVQATVGGTATLTFQAEIDKCKKGDAIVNRVNISTADAAETAIAVTQCVDDDSDSDSH